MLRKIRNTMKTVLFGKKKQYKPKKGLKYYFVTWRAHDALRCKVDNLIKHLKLKEVQRTGLIGDPKDAKKFEDQWSN